MLSRILRFVVVGVVVTVGGLALPVAAGAFPFNPASGTITADSGFRPNTNGYSFENYGNDINPQNLGPNEMAKLYGRAVCTTDTGPCRLIPAADEWAKQVSGAMNDGHCEGMANSASLWYYGLGTPPTPAPLGSATVPGFDIGNTAMQRHIAYTWAFQELPSSKNNTIKGTPGEILDAVVAGFLANSPRTVGIYMKDGTGGHALTPIFISERPNGLVDLVVYDNNFPNQLRTIIVNPTQNTWQYLGGTNPNNADSIYSGTAQSKTLELAPITPNLGTQPCGFCDENVARRGPSPETSTLYWSGASTNDRHSDMTVVDEDGNKAGCEADANGLDCKNEIEGAIMSPRRLGDERIWDKSPQPAYELPNGDYTVVLDGQGIEGLSFIRDRLTIAVDDVELDSDERQVIDFSGRRTVFKNEKGDREQISVRVGFKDPEDGRFYEFGVKASDIEQNDAVEVEVDREEGTFELQSRGDRGEFSVKVEVREGQEKIELADSEVSGQGGEVVKINYREWEEGDDSAPIGDD